MAASKLHKVAALEPPAAEVEKFLDRLAEELALDPLQMVLVVKKRNGMIRWGFLRRGFLSDDLGLLQFTQLALFEDLTREDD